MPTRKKPIRIVLVDDDSDDCELFQDALKESSVSAILKMLCEGEDLMTELAALAEPLPDVIFLDVNMPKKNGREVLDEIRSNPKFKNVLVIMFSTSLYKEDIDYAY